MILFARAVLILWLPTVLSIFSSRPPRRAVVLSFIAAWLFLPNILFDLPGLPDYTKMSATAIGVLMSVAIFDAPRLFALRPRLYDLPMALWCVCPFFSSISSNTGAYEGLAAVLDQLFAWGMPYLIGRMYFSDHEGIRQLALGMVIGGLVYVPLCLIEIRLSPVLQRWIYGLERWEGTRYGGYRPKVFMATGLELGMWMANATLIGYWLWVCGSIKKVITLGMGQATSVLLATTILCKSTGAGMLMVIGMGSLWMVRQTKKTWPVWMLIFVPPFYEISRTSGLWSGRSAVDFSKAMFGDERAQSLDFRMMNEDMMITRAMQRPLLGWGRAGGFQEVNAQGWVLTIIDGYWILTLGYFGIVGAAAMTATWLLPLILLIRRQPAETWSRPETGTAAVLCVMLALYMTDNLSNAMPNPIYALALGGLVALPSIPRGGGVMVAESSLAVADDLVGESRLVEAESEFRRAIALASAGSDLDARRVQAEAMDGLGHLLMTTDRSEEAELALRDALAFREAMAAEVPDVGRFRDLAIARERLGRAIAEIGRTAEAIEHRQVALRVWDELTTCDPGDEDSRCHRVDALNDLAWLLATDPDPTLRDPARALGLAEEAVGASADRAACWNTLGVARYRARDWPGAVEALERSVATDPGGGTAFDYFFLAMACRRLDDDRARPWLERGVAWASRHRPRHPALGRFRQEAESLLGEPDDAPATDVS